MSALLKTAARQSSRRVSYSTRLWSSPCRHTSTSHSASQHTSAGDHLASRLQRTALGGALILTAVWAVYYYASQPVLHLDGEAAFPGPQTKRATKATIQPNVPKSALGAQYGSHEDVQKAIEELRTAIPRENAVNTDPQVLQLYGSSDKSYHPTAPHSVVVHPHSTEEVVAVVNIARRYKVPIVPYSGATSLEGHFSGVGVSLLKLSAQQLTLDVIVSFWEHLYRFIRHEQNH